MVGLQLNESDGSDTLPNFELILFIVQQVENNYKKDFCETSQMCIDVPFIELNGDGIAWVAAITCFQDMHNERFKLLITQH